MPVFLESLKKFFGLKTQKKYNKKNKQNKQPNIKKKSKKIKKKINILKKKKNLYEINNKDSINLFKKIK